MSNAADLLSATPSANEMTGISKQKGNSSQLEYQDHVQ